MNAGLVTPLIPVPLRKDEMTEARQNSSSHRTQPKAQAPFAADRSYPSADLIHQTIRVWEPRLGRPLTEEDARRILENIVGFFRVLHGWDGRPAASASDRKNGADPDR